MIMKDEKKQEGTVDEHLLEQFCKSELSTFAV